jgi:hypothetical protein
MKTIGEIKNEQQKKVDELLTNCHVFFAFNKEQMEEGKAKHPIPEGEKYTRIPGGGFLPSSQVENFMKGIEDIDNWYKEEVKSNNARRALIEYELANHEAWYTGSIEDTMRVLGDDYTREEVWKVYREEAAKQD